MTYENCPGCGGKLRDETLGWICESCKGFLTMQGDFYPHTKKQFMPPMTNGDKMRRMSDEELARLITEAHIEGANAALEGARGARLSNKAISVLFEAGIKTFLPWLREPATEEGGEGDV